MLLAWKHQGHLASNIFSSFKECNLLVGNQLIWRNSSKIGH